MKKRYKIGPKNEMKLIRGMCAELDIYIVYSYSDRYRDGRLRRIYKSHDRLETRGLWRLVEQRLERVGITGWKFWTGTSSYNGAKFVGLVKFTES